MSEDEVILPSIASGVKSLTVNDRPVHEFGYNPSLGPHSNEITETSLNLLLNRKTINLTPTSAHSIYDRNISGTKKLEISISSLSFLFCEVVNWSHRSSKGIQDLENRLNGLGYKIGQRTLELVKLRERFKNTKREIRLVEMLQFIHSTLWKSLFGEAANELERSQDISNEYMITDNCPLMAKFINIPKDYGNLNCSALTAGIIEGALDSAGFYAHVSAHSVPTDQMPQRTVFLIKVEEEVLIREDLRGA